MSLDSASLFQPLEFPNGKVCPNRIMVAPLTNLQSEESGVMSEDEFNWLTMRAKGGFGITMTCASHVQKVGKGFPGQLGVFSDELLPGLKRLASEINKYGSLSMIQLHHAGVRTPKELIEEDPVSSSDVKKDDGSLAARGLSNGETLELIDSFVEAAKRSEKAGFRGVQLHCAHGYILAQYISKEFNKRADEFGGSLENRSKIIFEILKRIKAECSPELIVSVRLSPEKFGMELDEVLWLSQKLIDSNLIDFLDISLWDVFKKPEEIKLKDKLLIDYFSELTWGNVKFVVAGKIHEPKDALWCLEKGADFVALGKMAILHHDYPNLVKEDPDFSPINTPVSKEYLENEGLGPKFISYMSNRWNNFVKE